MNQLFHGDNLEVLRNHIATNSVDLCYIDPPFHSKRNYHRADNNAGANDTERTLAFTDTWTWDDCASAGLEEILGNASNRFQPQMIELIKGLHAVQGRSSLLAYLVSTTLRINEIQRVLTPQGSFYLHCDPTASHYLKLLLDAIFCSQGGKFMNEIIWSYKTGGASKRHFSRKHDVIFLYSKGKDWTFNPQKEKSYMMHKYGFKKSNFQIDKENDLQYSMVYSRDVLEIPTIGSDSSERLGYPTQKPEALLRRLILASSNAGDVVLDAYCGCGTTLAVAHALKRRWIGIDITGQSIAAILKRFEAKFSGQDVLSTISINGIPSNQRLSS